MALAGLVAGAKSALMRAAPFASGFLAGLNTKKIADTAVAGAGGYIYFNLLEKDRRRKGFTKEFSALRHLGPVAVLAVADAYLNNDMLHSFTQGVAGAMVAHWQRSRWVKEFRPAVRAPSKRRTSPAARRWKTTFVIERPILGGVARRPPALGIRLPVAQPFPIKMF